MAPLVASMQMAHRSSCARSASLGGREQAFDLGWHAIEEDRVGLRGRQRQS